MVSGQVPVGSRAPDSEHRGQFSYGFTGYRQIPMNRRSQAISVPGSTGKTPAAFRQSPPRAGPQILPGQH
jgi:hypothetical protein